MKIVIRGEREAGKSTLMNLLLEDCINELDIHGGASWWWGASNAAGSPACPRSEPGLAIATQIQREYTPTRQIQVCNIPWKYKGICLTSWVGNVGILCPVDSKEIVKIELWDVVDEGSPPYTLIPENVASYVATAASGTSRVEVVDAKQVDAYRHANGVILLFDLSKPDGLDYVVKMLPSVPLALPVLVIGNFVDRLGEFKDEDFLRCRLQAIRAGICKAGDDPAPLHFMVASLTHPSCPQNPSAGVINAVTKFFEIPFLKLQKDLLTTKLLINEEKMYMARDEWGALIESSGKSIVSPQSDLYSETDSKFSEIPIDADTSIRGQKDRISSFSTDTLTLSTGQAWQDQPSFGDPKW